MQSKRRLCLCFIQGRERIFEFAGANQAGCISMPETDHCSDPCAGLYPGAGLIPELFLGGISPHADCTDGHHQGIRLNADIN